ncbi:1,3-beta-D-glucan synthase [Ceratobasidium sp. 428]|nr:1,3-beta-D-glucan synthase [Ceratobasidium sp. 428]
MCRAIPLPPHLDPLDICRHRSATCASVTDANKLIATLHNTPGLSYCAPLAALRPDLCLLFLLVTLGLTCGPTFYTGFVNDGSDRSSLPLILGIVQFFLAVIATLLLSILPSGRMFGDRVAGKSRKYLASQTFTTSYPTLTRNQRLGSIAL